MPNFPLEKDFEKIDITLKNELNNLLGKKVEDNFPEELQNNLDLLIQQIINFQEQQNTQKRDLQEKEINLFKEKILNQYILSSQKKSRYFLEKEKVGKLFFLFCSLSTLIQLMSGLFLMKKNMFTNTLESTKKLYKGINLIVTPVEYNFKTIPIKYHSLNPIPISIQIYLLKLLKKIDLNSLDRLSYAEKKDDSIMINYGAEILRATRSGILSIEKNIKERQDLEQKQKNKLALERFKQRIERRKKEGRKETPETREFEKTFYEIMDSFRPEGGKLYQEN